LLAIETANAHQESYYQTWLKKCLAGTECGVYGTVSEYITILSTTELATCNAQNSSLNGIREMCSLVLRHGSLETSEHMVTYNYEPVQGDKDTTSVMEKIEEFEHSLNIAETEKAKALAKLNLLREGGLPVDEYMDVDKPIEVNNGTADWDYNEDHDDDHEDHHVTEVNYYSYDQISYGDGHHQVELNTMSFGLPVIVQTKPNSLLSAKQGNLLNLLGFGCF